MKHKTIKSLSKRFKITSTGKVRKHKAGQNHFNMHESGKIKRNKRRDVTIGSKKQSKLIRKLI